MLQSPPARLRWSWAAPRKRAAMIDGALEGRQVSLAAAGAREGLLNSMNSHVGIVWDPTAQPHIRARMLQRSSAAILDGTLQGRRPNMAGLRRKHGAMLDRRLEGEQAILPTIGASEGNGGQKQGHFARIASRHSAGSS